MLGPTRGTIWGTICEFGEHFGVKFGTICELGVQSVDLGYNLCIEGTIWGHIWGTIRGTTWGKTSGYNLG